MGLVGILVMTPSSVAQGQGLTVTSVTTPQSLPAGLGGLASLAAQFGADIPTEFRETIYVSADGTMKRVERMDGATIYNLTGAYLIEVDYENQTWEMKPFEEVRQEFEQAMTAFGRGGNPDGGPPTQVPPPDPSNMDFSINLSVDAQGETQDLNGFSNAELFHQLVEVETSGQASPTAPGMSGNFVAAMQVWAVDRSQFDLTPLREFDRQLAEVLLGVQLGASQDFASSMLSSPQAQEMIAQFESQMGELADLEPVSTLTEIYILAQGQEFDLSQAFQEPTAEPEPAQGGGGGGLFGGLGAVLGGLSRGGGGNPPPTAAPGAGGGQTSMGSTRVDYIDYMPGAPDGSLFEAPGAPFQEQ